MRYIALLGIVAVLFCFGCSDESIDTAFNLIGDFGVESITPSQFTPGEVTTLTVSCDTEYEGLVRVQVSGHGGGSDVGELKSPIEAPVGTVYFSRPLEAGKTLISLEIEMLLDRDYVAFSVHVALDSLLVDGALVHWQSDEGKDLYEDDIPGRTAFLTNSSYLHVDLYNADSE